MSKKGRDDQYDQIIFDTEKGEFERDSVESPEITEEHLVRAEEILGVLARMSGYELKELLIHTRKRYAVNARYNFYPVMRKEFPEVTLRSLGSFFPGKKSPDGQDHATVSHALRTDIDLCQVDKEYRDFSEKLSAALRRLEKQKKATI